MAASAGDHERPNDDTPAGGLPPGVGRALRAIDSGSLVVAIGAWLGVAMGAELRALALVASAVWMAIQSSQAGRWLRSVWRFEAVRARALVTTGLARADHRRGVPGALARAGDAYEREGRARSALRGLGAEPSRALGWLRPIAERLASLR